MATMNLRTHPGRIERQKGAILKYALPTEVLAKSANMRTMRAHDSDTIIFRRWLPQGATLDGTGTEFAENFNNWDVKPEEHLLTEGVTPPTQDITPQNVPVVIRQYGVLFSYTDQTANLYEDNFREVMRKRTGETIGLIKELTNYNTLRATTTKFYTLTSTGAQATMRSQIATAMKSTDLRRVSMYLQTNGGMKVKPALMDRRAGNDSSNVEESFCVYCHTNMEATIRALDNFTPVSDYARFAPISQYELGADTNFRFILSKELNPYLASGGTSSVMGELAVQKDASNKVHVFPVIIMAQSAWATVSLANLRSVKDVTELPVGVKTKSDPLGQLGFIGAKIYHTSFIENDGWMAVLESAALAA